MNDMLVIHYDPFSEESPIFIYRDNQQSQTVISSNISELSKNIMNFIDKTNIFSVKINAPSSVVEEIEQQLTTINYAKQKIEVEGI